MDTQQKIVQSWFQSHGLPPPVPEYRFHDKRRWRFDWAWPDYHIAVEIEGGIWSKGRHVRGTGFINDMDKYNTATAMGWRVIRVQPKQFMTTYTLDFVKEIFK